MVKTFFSNVIMKDVTEQLECIYSAFELLKQQRLQWE